MEVKSFQNCCCCGCITSGLIQRKKKSVERIRSVDETTTTSESDEPRFGAQHLNKRAAVSDQPQRRLGDSSISLTVTRPTTTSSSSSITTTTTKTMMHNNISDVVSFVHKKADNLVVEMSGLLMMEQTVVLGLTSNGDTSVTSTSSSSSPTTTTDLNSSHTSSDPDDLSVMTVQAKLIGNLLYFWDCTLDVNQLLKYPHLTKCLILEQTVVEVMPASALFPYGMTLSFPALDDTQLEQFQMSAFSDEDRRDWTEAITNATCELTKFQMRIIRTEEQQASSGSSLSRSDSHDTPLDALEASIKVDEKLAAGLVINWDKVLMELKPPSNKEQTIICQEWMAESKLSILFPPNLIRLYRLWTQQMRNLFTERLLYLPESSVPLRGEHLRLLQENIERYDEALEFLDQYASGYFRPSCERHRMAFAFTPTNLHFHSFHVLTYPEPEHKPDYERFDFWTFGACSAIPLRFTEGSSVKLTEKMENLIGDASYKLMVEPKQFWARKHRLEELRQKTSALAADVLRTWSADNETFRNGKSAVVFLSQLNEIKGCILDWSSSVPYLSDIVDQQLLPHACRMKPVPFVPTRSMEDLWAILDSQCLSLNTKIAAMDVIDGKREQNKIVNGNDTSADNNQCSFDQWLSNTRTVAQQTLTTLENICDTLLDAFILHYLTSIRSKTALGTFYSLKLRNDIILCMALTCACSAILGEFWLLKNSKRLAPETIRQINSWSSSGVLITLLGHMSCYGDEYHMIEEHWHSWQMVSRMCRFRFVATSANVSNPSCLPLVDGQPHQLLISLPIPEPIFQQLPSNLRQPTSTFRMHCAYWNIGVNHEAYFGSKIGANALEMKINTQSLRITEQYIERLKIHYGADVWSNSVDGIRMRQLVNKLNSELKNTPGMHKNVRVLNLASQIGQLVGGPVFLGCKSGKDRTAMAVTLEQCRILRQNSGLSEADLPSVLDQMRLQSVRRQNCFKNIGVKLYSFSTFQMPFLPQLYRAPTGTYGQYQT